MPRAHILVLSMHNDAMIVARSLEAGASGYVLKDTSSEELVKAVQQVSAGLPFLSSELAIKVALTRTTRDEPARRADPARVAGAGAARRRQALRAIATSSR